MKSIDLENHLTDICTESILTYKQATQLWKLLANKRKMWRAAEDANKRGFSDVHDFAVAGVYHDDFHGWKKQAELTPQMFYAPPCQRCKHFYPIKRNDAPIEWCHAEQEQDFSCFNR
jgi:hypothetical protein